MHINDDGAIKYLSVIMWPGLKPKNVQSSIVHKSWKSGNISKAHQRKNGLMNNRTVNTALKVNEEVPWIS